jgi:hypothetical protein
MAPTRRRRTLHALGTAVTTWWILSLPVGGLSRLLYYAVGQPGWFPWLAVVVVPAMLALCVTNAIDAYREAPAKWFAPRRWGRFDTVGLLVLTLLAAVLVSTWMVTGNFPLAVATVFVLVGIGLVAYLVVGGLRMSRQHP